MTTLNLRNHEITLQGLDAPFQSTVTARQLEDGLELVHLKITTTTPATPPICTLAWTQPLVDIHACWNTAADHNKSLPVSWSRGFISKATSQAPVVSLYSLSGENRLTYAFSDALHAVAIKGGVHEETATYHNILQLFTEATPPLTEYEAYLRIDTRAIPYYESLADVERWWAQQPGYQPAPVPAIARQPMYSTWYSFHQQLTAAEVEEECRIARGLGCHAVIVDDGWQTTDNSRGYAYTGDWEVTAEKIANMQEHVARVHDLGMKYLLWYSVPFVGEHSKAYHKFSHRLLDTIKRLGAGVLDPRFPEVREYIISTYETALRQWDLDGFKLDFVDSFTRLQQQPWYAADQQDKPELTIAEGQDYLGVPEAVDRLLTDTMQRLRAIKPDIMIEFRQSYIGPLMRKYGNMFRAGDCPNDLLTNRERTLDVRLLSGNTATHADMLMWHKDDPVESAALQIINILFSVPQISVRLATLPEDHLTMVRYWLAFWNNHRDVLLDGKLVPLHPESNYPLVIATNEHKQIAVAYEDLIINPVLPLPETFILVNGTRGTRLVLELTEDASQRTVEIRDCQGKTIRTVETNLTAGLHSLHIPPAGIATII